MNGIKLTKDKMLSNLYLKYGNKFEFEIKDLTGRNKTRVITKCNKCGAMLDVSYRVLIDKNFKCPSCERVPVNKLDPNLVRKKIESLNYEIIDGTYDSQDSELTLKCLDCGRIFTTTYKKLRYKKKGCSACQYNNMRNSPKDIKEKLQKEYNGTIIAISDYQGITKPMKFRCLVCGNEWENRADSVLNKHIGCHVCTKGVSYPNKLMKLILLKFLKEGDILEEEYMLKKIDQSWDGLHRFDFRYNNLIIEMDGGLSHEDKTIDDKKDNFAKKHNFDVIRIDCNYNRVNNRFTTIKKNILNSNLKNIFNFDIIKEEEWLDLDKKAQESIYKDIYIYYLNNRYKTKKQIAKELKKHRETITRAIKLYENDN